VSEAAGQDPELTTVGSSATGSPAFESIKSAERTIATVLKSHRSRVEGARSALAAAERAYESRVANAKTAVDRAAQPNKIAAIGIVRRVTLTETTITTPKGQFELTPEVDASAEQHGNKQVVQGWVFKSDHDRREIYLHINGPTWGDVVPFSVRHSLSEPRDLHAFATKVSATARNVEAAKAAIAERVRAAESEVIQALRDRAGVEQAAAALVAVTWEVDEVKAVKDRVEAFVADAPAADRRAKKARERVQALHEQGNRWAQEALREQERVRGDSEFAQREATSREQMATRPVQPAGRETPDTKPRADSEPETSGANNGDILDQIRKLGELHEAGVLTTEEFSSKKAELLGRL
jgi:hypothetical protein